MSKPEGPVPFNKRGEQALTYARLHARLVNGLITQAEFYQQLQRLGLPNPTPPNQESPIAPKPTQDTSE